LSSEKTGDKFTNRIGKASVGGMDEKAVANGEDGRRFRDGEASMVNSEASGDGGKGSEASRQTDEVNCSCCCVIS